MKDGSLLQIFEVLFGAILYYFLSWLFVLGMASMAHIPLGGSEITLYAWISLGAGVLAGIICGLVFRKLQPFWSAALAVLVQLSVAHMLVHSVIGF